MFQKHRVHIVPLDESSIGHLLDYEIEKGWSLMTINMNQTNAMIIFCKNDELTDIFKTIEPESSVLDDLLEAEEDSWGRL